MNEAVVLNQKELMVLESLGKSVSFVAKGSIVWGALFTLMSLFATPNLEQACFCITVFLFGFMALKLAGKIQDVFKEENPSRKALVQIGESLNDMARMLQLGIILTFVHFFAMTVVAFVLVLGS